MGVEGITTSSSVLLCVFASEMLARFLVGLLGPEMDFLRARLVGVKGAAPLCLSHLCEQLLLALFLLLAGLVGTECFLAFRVGDDGMTPRHPSPWYRRLGLQDLLETFCGSSAVAIAEFLSTKG